ncbi:hypothetical protein BRADI_4g14639v3, partial [Brachypodium distachyon]
FFFFFLSLNFLCFRMVGGSRGADMSKVPYSLLRELNDDSQDWRVRDDELIRLHFVVVDEKGQIAKFKDVIKEGSVYYLQNFELTLARDNYRAVDHKYEMRFTSWTTISVIDPAPPEFPLHVYKLCTFQNIMESVTDKTVWPVPYVLGIVTGVSELLSADVKGRVISMRIIRLTDTRHTAIVSLWRTNAERLDTHALVRLSEPEPVIVLIMGCTFRMQDGGLWVSFCVVSAMISLLASFENTNVVALAALIPHNAMNKMFMCKVHINSVAEGQTWWFLSCDICTSRAVEEGDGFSCTNSNCSNRTASP